MFLNFTYKHKGVRFRCLARLSLCQERALV